MQFHKILFPTDFSAASRAMAPQVRDMAKRCSAELTVLHSFNVIPGYNASGYLGVTGQYMDTAVPYVTWMAELRDSHQNHLRTFARESFEGIECNVMMQDGDPATTIDKVSERDRVDLIMMPTRGLGTFRRLLLGSVTAKVLHDVNCAVFTSAHELDPGSVPHDGYNAIICAVELNHEAERILRTAAAFAQMCGASLEVVHADPSRHSGGHSPDLDVSAILANAGVVARVRILEEDVAPGVRRAAVEEKADLVVVGRGHERGTISRLWSELYKIICESPCPVLSV